MNKLFSPFNFCILLLILILGSIAHLMYGHCQTTKLHFMLQYHFMPNHLPNWMLKYDKDFDAYLTLDYSDALVDKNYTGKWSAWYRNGGKYCEVEYKNGKKNGKNILWYESGIKILESEYKEDYLNGKFIRWYKNGAKEDEGEYKDGEVNGKFISWNESGVKKYEGDYIDGKQNGKTTEWDANGKKIKEQEWKDDVMIKDYLE